MYKEKDKITQYKPRSTFVFIDTLRLYDFMRCYIDKGDFGRFLFELYFKTPYFAAAFKDFKDIEVCNAGEAIRSLKSIKKNVLNIKDSDENVINIFEELKKRKYLWYTIEHATNGEIMIHYILLDYPVGDIVVFEKPTTEKNEVEIPFKIKTDKWIRGGSLNSNTKEISIERVPIYDVDETESKSICNSKPVDLIAINRDVFKRRVKLKGSDSVEKILFEKSKDFRGFFVDGTDNADEILLDEGEAFWDLISSTVCRDIGNPVSFFAPALTVDNEIIFNNEFFSKRWHWDDEGKVEMFFEKIKDFLIKKDVLDGKGFVVLSKMSPAMIETPVYPGNQHFDEIFERIMPSNITEKAELETYIKNNVDVFVQSYFFRGTLCPDGKARECFDKYNREELKNSRKRK